MYPSSFLTVLGAIVIPATGTVLTAAPWLTLGYAECPTTTFFGGQLVTGERKDLYVVPGHIEPKCGDWRDKPLGRGENYQDKAWFQYSVCGKTLNFAPSDKFDGYDIYQDGQYNTIGYCVPHEGNKNFCADFLNGGTCTLEAKFWCGWTGPKDQKPC